MKKIYLALSGSLDKETSASTIDSMRSLFIGHEIQYYDPLSGQFNPSIPNNADYLVIVPPVLFNEFAAEATEKTIWIGKGLYTIIYNFVETKVIESTMSGLLNAEEKEHALSGANIPMVLLDFQYNAAQIKSVRIKGTDWKRKYAEIGFGGFDNFSDICFTSIKNLINE